MSQDPQYGNLANTMHKNNNIQYGYPQTGHGYQRSYDNVTAQSGSGSGNTDYQTTDPSSLNSSYDQLQQHALHQQRMEERAQAEYGFNGFGAGPNMKNGHAQPIGDPNWGGPVGGRPPAQSQAQPKTPMAMGGGGSSVLQKKDSQSGGEKRKSWFKRRFSKD
jgi:hypothetical protein